MEKAGRGTMKTGPSFPRKKRRTQVEFSPVRVFLSIRFHVSEMVNAQQRHGYKFHVMESTLA